VITRGVFLGLLLAWATGLAASAPADRPPTRPGANASTVLGDDEVDKLLAGLSDEQIEKLIAQARLRQLQAERRQVVAEIRGELLYAILEPGVIEEAVALITTDPADTQADNIQRICKVFAKVDPRFARVWELFAADKHAAAAKAAKPVLDPERTTYLSAAMHWMYAEALARSGEHEQAVEAYRDVMVRMPERMSFAASSALAAARLYEADSRFLYAMEMYTYYIKNYGLTLTKARADRLIEKIEAWGKLYEDPLGTVAKKMTEVELRLARSDSGPQTQQREKEIVALLDDLIKNGRGFDSLNR